MLRRHYITHHSQ